MKHAAVKRILTVIISLAILSSAPLYAFSFALLRVSADNETGIPSGESESESDNADVDSGTDPKTDDEIATDIVIDDLSAPSLWTSEQAAVLSAYYLSDTEYLSSGPEDKSYALVRSQSVYPNDPIAIQRTFDAPVNLYHYGSVGFYVYISAPDIVQPDSDDILPSEPVYTVSMTLQSGMGDKSFEKNVDAGGWVHVIFSLEQWNLRTHITGISISVAVSYADGEAGAEAETREPFFLSYRVDAITAQDHAATDFEDAFMTAYYYIEGGQYRYHYDTGEIEITSVGGDVEISGAAIFADPVSARSYNTLRISLSAEDDITVSLIYTKQGREPESAGDRTVSGDGERTVLFFDLPDAYLCTELKIKMSGVTSGVRLYGISALGASTAQSIGLGTLDSVTLCADESVSLRGTVPADTVIDHLNGKIAVYCIPPYLDDYEYIKSSEPVITVDMTTRFNINIPPQSLPDGYVCMRFAATVEDGGEPVIIGAPVCITSSDAAAVKLPESSVSLKGIADDAMLEALESYAAAGAGAALITVDLSSLFGTASAGRLYSAAGEIYYFDSEYIKALDSAVKRLSEMGTDCNLRLICGGSSLFYPEHEESAAGGPYALRADNASAFTTLYAAVDFLSSRYNGGEYGFIRGMTAGESPQDEYAGAELTYSERAHLIFGVLSVMYHTGAANISGFRVYLPCGDETIMPVLSSAEGDYDSATLLYLIGRYIGIGKPFPYGLMWQTDSAAEGIDSLEQLLGCLPEFTYAPDDIILCYSPRIRLDTTAGALLNYVRAYYAACAEPVISRFIFDMSGAFTDKISKIEFLAELRLLDTELYDSVEQYLYEYTGAIVAAEENAASRAHVRVYELGGGSADPLPIDDFTGSYTFFDFTEAFDSQGWYAAGEGVECTTVKIPASVSGGTVSGRAMRAVFGAGGSVMYYSYAQIDLSAAPFLAIRMLSDPGAEYELILYSAVGTYTARLPDVAANTDNTVYVDISGFAGSDAVTGMEIRTTGEAALYIEEITAYSSSHTSDELVSLYSTASSDAEETQELETNILKVTAVCFLAVVASAGAIAALRRRGDGEDEHTKAEAKGRTGVRAVDDIGGEVRNKVK